MLEILLAVVGSSALSTLISCTFTLISTRRKKDSDVVAGLRMLLYIHLKREGKEYIETGWISSEDLEDFMKMHEVYHTGLGGNGFLDSVVAQVKALKIVD